MTYLEDHETRNENKYGTHKIILLHLAVYFVIREFLTLLVLQLFLILCMYEFMQYELNKKLFHGKHSYGGFARCHRDLRDVRVYHAVSLVGIKPYQH